MNNSPSLSEVFLESFDEEKKKIEQQADHDKKIRIAKGLGFGLLTLGAGALLHHKLSPKEIQEPIEYPTLHAQNLDNMGKDHLFRVHRLADLVEFPKLDKETLDPKNWDKYLKDPGVKAYNSLSKTSKSGTSYKKDEVELVKDKHNFFVKVPSIEKDVAGRTAPIILHAPIKDHTHNPSVNPFRIEQFGKKIGRTFSKEHMQAAADLIKKHIESDHRNR
jgi:hypothetical protein